MSQAFFPEIAGGAVVDARYRSSLQDRLALGMLAPSLHPVYAAAAGGVGALCPTGAVAEASVVP
jgi:hypothetical protein